MEGGKRVKENWWVIKNMKLMNDGGSVMWFICCP